MLLLIFFSLLSTIYLSIGKTLFHVYMVHGVHCLGHNLNPTYLHAPRRIHLLEDYHRHLSL